VSFLDARWGGRDAGYKVRAATRNACCFHAFFFCFLQTCNMFATCARVRRLYACAHAGV
jgi:hypothetical protein